MSAHAFEADMDIEIVRAAIEGFAEGYIDLPAPKDARHGKPTGYCQMTSDSCVTTRHT
jgi:hypothetical protein